MKVKAFIKTLLLLALPTSVLAKDYTFEDLQKLLKDKPNMSSVEEFLDQLPPEMTSLYTLMFKSKAIQKATPENPRAIMSNPSGTLFMSFNSDPKLYVPGEDPHDDGVNPYRTIEMIRFDENTNRYEMFELAFPGPGSDEKMKLVGPNPQKCLRCHGEDPRPLWTSYPFWEGAYGGRADYEGGFGMDDQESTNLQAFLKTAETHPRFKFLKNLKKGYESKLDEDYESGIGSHHMSHNLILSSLIFRNNMKRVLRLIKATPHIEAFKFALVSANFCRESYSLSGAGEKYYYGQEFFRDFFPEDIWNVLKSGPYSSDVQYSVFNARDLRSPSAEPVESAMRFIFDNRGINTEEWSTFFKSKEIYQLSTVGVPDTYMPLIIALFPIDDPIWKYFKKTSLPGEYFYSPETMQYGVGPYQTLAYDFKKMSGSSDYANGVFCKEMAKRSREALSKIDPRDLDCNKTKISLFGLDIPINTFQPHPAVPKTCLKCHGMNSRRANPPFVPQAVFKKYLKIERDGKTNYERMMWRLDPEKSGDDVMPPAGHTITPEEKERFIHYLKTLK